MSKISVYMTGDCLMGKKIDILGVADNTSLVQFAESFIPQLGFSFLMGSLFVEFLGKSNFVFKDKKCFVSSPNKEKSVVEGTFCGSTNVTCVASQNYHPIDLKIKNFDGRMFSLKCNISWTVAELGRSLWKSGLIRPGAFIQVNDYSVNSFNTEHSLAEFDVDEKSLIVLNPPENEEERLTQIQVKCFTGENMMVEVSSRETVSQIKIFVSEKLGIPISSFRLINSGKELDRRGGCIGGIVHVVPCLGQVTSLDEAKKIEGLSYQHALVTPLFTEPKSKVVAVGNKKMEKKSSTSTSSSTSYPLSTHAPLSSLPPTSFPPFSSSPPLPAVASVITSSSSSSPPPADIAASAIVASAVASSSSSPPSPTIASASSPSFQNKNKEVKLRVRNLEGQVEIYEVFLEYTVRQFKLVISERKGILPNSFNLIYLGRRIDNTDLINFKLFQFGIFKDAINLVPTIMGGGGGVCFVDVTAGRMVKLVVSATAPDWRLFGPGLTIEGVCKTATCVANGKKVNCIHGYTTFRLGKDESRCPMCRAVFEPIRPKYYKCVVVYHGMKTNKSRVASAPRVFKELESYDEKEAGMVNYQYLIIEVTKPETLIKDPQSDSDAIIMEYCQLCHKTLQREAVEFPGMCGHMFHKVCVEKWTERIERCPSCSMQFEL